MIKKLVFMEHDGAIDDLLSQLLLQTMEDVELVGINITPADCYIEPAIESSTKLLSLFGMNNVTIGRSDYNGVNAFPNEWRARPEIINVLPMMINIPYKFRVYELEEAVEHLIRKLSESVKGVTILVTGPCTNIVRAIERAPHIKNKIEEIIWMGGAFYTQGNVQTYQHNGSAEWNVYWDPYNSKKLFEMNLPLVCVSLDITNKVPVNKVFLSRLAKQSEYSISNLAGQLWALTIDTIPSYHYVYFMWDVLATSFISLKDAFELEEITAKVLVHPPNAGKTVPDINGSSIKIVTEVDVNIFYDYVLNQFKR